LPEKGWQDQAGRGNCTRFYGHFAPPRSAGRKKPSRGPPPDADRTLAPTPVSRRTELRSSPWP